MHVKDGKYLKKIMQYKQHRFKYAGEKVVSPSLNSSVIFGHSFTYIFNSRDADIHLKIFL